jgi:predicted negative regulator of RcsB-dependent stress response/thiol-disulfide isomerase/thioredoxin
MSRFIRWPVATILLTIGLLLCHSVSAAFKYIEEGMDVPEISGTDIISGNSVSSTALYRDNLVIVVFWATWSPRSLTQLEDLKAVQEEYADHPIRIIAVNVDAPTLTADDRQRVLSQVEQLGLSFPVIVDDGLSIFYDFGVIAVPSTAVIDTSGILRYGPASYSLSTRDRIVDSIRVFLGLAEPEKGAEFAVRYRPDPRAGRFFGLARKLAAKGSYERALAILDSAQAADSGFASVHTLRGEVLLNLGRQDSATSEYARAVQLDSLSTQAWTGWGHSLLQKDLLSEAREKLEVALALDDTYTPAFLNLGLCLAKQGETAAAIDSLELAKELNPSDPYVHYFLGRVERLAGNQQSAAEAYLTALDLLFPD